MNDEILTTNTKELTEDQWLLILWSLVTDFPEKEWSDFSHDLIYRDRFSSSHRVVEVVKTYAGRCTKIIENGHVFYRARIYHKDPLRVFLSNVFMNMSGQIYDENPGNINEYYNMYFAAIMMAVENGSTQGKAIIDTYNKWQHKRFKGYNASASGAPPADIGSAGRLNPEKIKYLYLAEDPETAAYEVRPTIGQHVSVATFKTKDKIKVYDLAGEIEPEGGETQGNDYTLFRVIQQRFSEPNTGDGFRYIPTQYLGELIKQMGFDGIRFKSSLKKGGIVVVLFDDQKCKAVRSDIIKVGDIKLSFENPDIYQLEELFKSDKGSYE